MLKQFRKLTTLTEDEMWLGEKRVKINKLTPNRWRDLFETVDRLPGIIVQVISAPQDDFYATVVAGLEVAMDEVIEIVAVLSDLDADYINAEVGVDEIFEYLTRTVKKNRLDSVAKNVKSLLPISPAE
ncbi:hypothetical protein RGU11_06755 [Rossellomorea marisflavi]|uniref:hypothetical protein n=1 Tax=Rossellomorea marisflavi TaxID=189381 RepID=UPI0028535A3C|nr:hypothetical protein [Rossellomorea marisflavi]MDR4936066.1 hypothetical protein [Rossellomorea marisflavi]